MMVIVLGNVFSWGGNEHGQLGVGDDVPRHVPTRVFIDDSGDDQEHVNRISCGAFHSAAVTLTGELAMWGWGEHGQLGIGGNDTHTTLPRLVDALSGMDVSLVTCGADYTIAVTDHFIVVQHDYFSRDPDQPVAYMPRSGSISEDRPPSLGRREPSATGASSRAISSSNGKANNNEHDDDDDEDNKDNKSNHSTSTGMGGGGGGGGITVVTTGNGSLPSTSTVPGVYADDSPLARGRPSTTSNHSAPSATSPPSSSTPTSSVSSKGDASKTASSAVPQKRGSLFGSLSIRKSATLPDIVAADSSLNGSSTAPAKRKKSIFDMVKDALSPSTTPSERSSTSTPSSSSSSSISSSTSVPSSLTSASVTVSPNSQTIGVDSRGRVTPLLSGFRPANLPPKSTAEVNKHRAEVNRMNEEYRKKLKREAEGKAMARQQEITRRHHEEKVRKAQAKKDIEREQKLDGAAHFWIKFVVPHWETKKYWSKARDTVTCHHIHIHIMCMTHEYACGYVYVYRYGR
jgi:hypothetical protein